MSRLRATFFSIALLAGLPLAGSAKDEVIYPRSAAPAGAPAETSGGSSRNLLTGLLGLACAAGAGWLYWRNRAMGGTGPGRSERKLTIAETRSLGNRQHLLVADYDGRKYLLGVCPGRIDLLTALNEANSKERS
jgi:flagellar protein FliO/FliZ